jgi:pentatricopeptide repeat protein
MEVKYKECTISVDDKRFLLSPVARITIEAMCTLVMAVSVTGQHKEAQQTLLGLVAGLLREHENTGRMLRDLKRYMDRGQPEQAHEVIRDMMEEGLEGEDGWRL